MNPVTEAIKKMFAAMNNTQHYCLAYSGGIDSHVLLHALAQHKPPSCQLRAIHIHHGLQIAADVWVEHCIEQARWLNVPLTIKHVDAKAPKGKSPEASARAARYAALAQMMTENEILLTAHNQNDQAETVFLQLLRGAGVKGLAAMPEQNQFSSGHHLRPLLNVSRATIVEYAIEHQLSWVEDPSNQNTHFDRNFLRQKVMPLLAERWPSFAQTVARSAQHCAEASTLIEEIAEQDHSIVTGNHQSLCITALLKLSAERQRELLRYWLTQQHFPIPSTTQLESLIRNVIHAAEDKMPLMQWPGVDLRRFKDHLFAMQPLSPFDSNLEIEWDGHTPLVLPADLGVLNPDDPRLIPIKDALSKKENRITIRFRQGGETMRLPGRQGTHELKKLFQEWEVLPWRRDRVPLIYINDRLELVLLSPDDLIK